MNAHSIIWTSPTPLWPDALDVATAPPGATTLGAFRQPAILRFASDQFMNEYLAILNDDPAKLREYVAQGENWQQPSPTPDPVGSVPSFVSIATRKAPPPKRTSNPPVRTTLPLKLYQPVHLRYYMVAGALVCRVQGLPNRSPAPELHERATFVVRRLSQKSGGDEYAFVNKVWTKLSNPMQLSDGEDQIPLPSSVYADRDNHKRRVFAGLIPVGRREEYMGAPMNPPSPEAKLPDDVRVTLLKTQVVQPIKSLYTLANSTFLVKDSATKNDKPTDTVPIRDQIQQESWYVLRDLGKFLNDYVNPVMGAIRGSVPESTLDAHQSALFADLDEPKYKQSDGTEISLRDALKTISNQAELDKLKNATGSYNSGDVAGAANWPDLEFRFADPDSGTPKLSPRPGLHKMTRLVRAALPQPAPKDVPPSPLVSAPGADPQGLNWFQVRLVFERPECGPLVDTIISEPTAPFQLAGFFDSDAPARPLLIPLPVDTTPAGLRKYDKNTGFVLSDVLCGQMTRMEGLSLGDLIMAVLPFPLHKDLPVGDDSPCGTPTAPAGQICSLSIPIVTICAFILLIMIVKLLDLVFHWMPFFRICLPIPNFSAKAGNQ